MKNIKVLIVEDEVLVGLDLKKTISQIGYNVSGVATDSMGALQSIKECEPSIVIMDINLKNSKDGIDTAVEIKKIKDIPVIFLTAFSDDETIKRAVQTDPAGYLVKPYNPEELKSMIQLGIYKSNTFRSDVAHEKQYSHIGHGYYFDRTTMELYYKEIPIKLSKKEKALIDILLKAKGDIVSLEKLELLIWYNKPVSSSSLRTLIYRTRAKLNNKVIVTVPYFGCKIDIPQE